MIAYLTAYENKDNVLDLTYLAYTLKTFVWI